ncbi:MAG: hypothetical protein K6T81_20095 [Alicyclobacillus macrosporangiidus]|uniref:hypothetical protein n=1 Tax=Alicyclobacillus macrosporangiidus TaxID=392015 RepID=UPI0026EFEBC7|nr:hypothetical protein [Alicyclobacillus macrosporangiidus]MCL6601013.1 hypothetical protein [Alicyclobacillus macrosporangiidus]
MLAVGLRDELKRGLPEQVQMCDTLEAVGAVVNENGNQNRAEEILVDSDAVDQAELYAFRQQHPECLITYIVDNMSQAMIAFAAAHNIRLVQAAKLVQYLQEQVASGPRLPSLAFWGVYPRLGTTTIALAVAHVLATQRGKNVGVLGLNAYNSGTWMLSERNHHLDDVVSFLVHNKLDRDTLLSAMESLYRVRYLPGLRNQTQALTLQPEHVDLLIAVASSAFDVLVLDLGSVLNTAMALQGMRIATHRYVVANDLASTRRQFFDHFDYVLKPLGISEAELLLIGSQLHSKGANFAKSVGLVPVAGIPYFPSIDLYAEQQSEPLKLFLGEKQFRRAVDTIVQSAVTATGAEVMAGVRA